LTRRVLFVPLHVPSLLEMLPIASSMAADGKYQPLFFLYRRNEFVDEHIHLLRQADLPVTGPGVTSESRSNRSQLYTTKQPLASLRQCVRWAVPATLRRTLKKYVRRAVPTTLRQILDTAADYTRKIKEANALLERELVAALVLMGDRHVGWETALIKAANQRGIPSLIVPIAQSFPETAARLRLRKQDVDRCYGMQTLSNRIAGALFPNWVYEFEGSRLLFSPGVQSVVAWALGIMPENPWTIGGGAATRMAVESPHLRRMFVEQGIPAEKLVVTGKPSVDQIYEAMQPANQHIIREELGIPEAEQVLLCAVPQLAEHRLMSWSQHWQEIEFLLATFAQLKNVSIVLSLHPKSDPSEYRPLADQYGTTLAKRRIYELLPACDVFVATFSSTVMQAIGLSKPTVIVDFYSLGYTFYDDAPGVIVLRSRDHLASTLAKLFSDPQYYDLLSEAQLPQTSEWVLLDGKCTERVAEELYRLIESPIR
jgi:hypothetical protein